MSKNIFSVLAKDDSDDERKPAKPEAPKVTKKERREKDGQLRETYGDKVQKDVVTHKRSDNAPKNKGDYAPNEKRPFERHSGTGRPAFKNEFKKGGHGKGNVGNQDGKEEIKVDEEHNDKRAEEKVVEPVEEIMGADEFIAKSGLNFNFLSNEVQVKNVKPPVINDPNLKVVAAKSKTETVFNGMKAKNPDSIVQVSKNIIDASTSQKQHGHRKNSPQQKKRVEYNELNFPSLA